MDKILYSRIMSNNTIMVEEKEQTQTAPHIKHSSETWLFVFSFLFVFILSLLFFMILDNMFSRTANITDSQRLLTTVETSSGNREPLAETSTPEKPTRIIIESVGIDVIINSPQSRDIAVLDAELKKGAVHYPGSGDLGEKTNMFLFGHSTNWETVQNPAYQSFNNLDKVASGDIIRVQSGSREYVYEARIVALVNSEEAWVSLENNEKLFISTCNTFGQKTDRFVVEADFVGSYEITQS